MSPPPSAAALGLVLALAALATADALEPPRVALTPLPPPLPPALPVVPGLNADYLDDRGAEDFAAAEHDHDARYYTEAEADARFLGRGAKAADAELLDGLDSTSFAAAGHDHDARYYTEAEADARYLGRGAKAADAELLDGLDSTAFLRRDTTGDMAGQRITGLGAPAAASDAATRAYVDAAVQALAPGAGWRRVHTVPAAPPGIVNTAVPVPAPCLTDGSGRGCLLFLFRGDDLTGPVQDFLSRAEYHQFRGAPFAAADKYVAHAHWRESGSTVSSVMVAGTNGAGTQTQVLSAGGSSTNWCKVYVDVAGVEANADHLVLNKQHTSGPDFGCHLYVRGA